MRNIRNLIVLLLASIWGLSMLPVSVAAENQATITAIGFSKNNLAVTADKKIVVEVSRRSDPPRLVVDVKSAVLSTKLLQGKGQYIVNVNGEMVKTIRASSNFGLAPSTRIVLDLANGADFNVSKNNTAAVSIALSPGKGSVAPAAAAAPAPAVTPEPAAAPVAAAPKPVEEPVVVQPTAATAEETPKPRGILIKPSEPEKVTIAPEASPAAEAQPAPQPVAEQPMVPQQATPIQAKNINFEEQYSTENPIFVTINLKDADIRDVLQVFAQKAKLNLMLDPSVTGSITLNLKEVPLNDAMNLILKLNDLEARKVGNTLIVATRTVFQAKNLDTTVAKNFRLNNAKADDAAKFIKDSLPQGSKATVVADNRTSSIIVTGTQEELDKVDNIIKTIDTRAQQVLIQVKLIDLNAQDSQALGVKYGIQQGMGAGGFNGPTTGIGLGAPRSTDQASITFNTLANLTSAFSAELDALVKVNKAKILANPSVATQDSQRATINITQGVVTGETAVQTQGAGTTSQLQITPVGIKLDILPKIDHEGYITMELKPALSVRGDSPGLTPITKVPFYTINERTATTVLRVKNGETIVVGGLTQEEKVTVDTKLPFLGDIPLLGGLFKNTTETTRNADVILLVTPYLVSDVTDDNARDAMEKARKPLSQYH